MPIPFGSALQLPHLATPTPNPPSGAVLLYFKADGNLYCKNSAGLESLVSSGPPAVRSARVVTTANITLSATQTVDGVALVAGDIVLVVNQTLSANNGVYTVAAGAWTRTPGYDTALLLAAASIAVEEGTSGGRIFKTYFKATDTLGTTAMSWYALLDTLSGNVSYVARSTYSAKGDTLFASASSTPAALPVGVDGTVLQADSTQATGARWGVLPPRSVRFATTANVVSMSGLKTIDGIVGVSGDLILVKNQTAPELNGVYTMAGTWARTPGYDTALLLAGAEVAVESGTVSGGLVYKTTFKSTDTLGTTAMPWYTMLGNSAFTAKGDMMVGTGALALATLPVGGDGEVLVADSAQATGQKWAWRSPNTQLFTASGTWTKPAGAVSVQIICVGGGGGGGSGRRDAAGTVRCGGGGGAGGQRAMAVIDASILGTTETVTVGAGGAGGPAGTVDTTDGAAGTAGAVSGVGGSTDRVLAAMGGAAGSGGTINTGTAGAAQAPGASAGAAASVTGGVGTSANNATGSGSTSTAAGGGAGAGVTAANVVSNGGVGGRPGAGGSPITGTTGGVSPGGTGQNGAAGRAGLVAGGAGGGGGASSITTAAGAGGSGANYGGGGGGGGASVNGQASGAGGAGAQGAVVIITHY